MTNPSLMTSRLATAALLALLACRLWAQAAAPAPAAAPAQPAIPPPPVATTIPATPAELTARVLCVVAQMMPGWRAVEQPQRCDRTCVDEHLPQDAELIGAYSFSWGLTVRLLPSESQQEVVVRVFRMTDQLDAFGMFSQHRHDQSVTAPVLTQSFWSGDEFHIWRGLFYIRVTPTAAGNIMHSAAMAAGEAVAAQIPIPDKLPLMMRLMPKGRNLPYTQRYYRQSVLGQAALGDGVVDTYVEDSTKLTLALLRAADEQAAECLYAVVLNIVSGSASNTVTRVPDVGRSAATVDSEQFGLCYAVREGRYVALALAVHDRGTAEGLLRIAATNIRISRFE